MSLNTQSLDADLANVIERARGSLVQVHNGARGAGAGTVWHSDGLILTNAHVVSHEPLSVTLPDGRRMPARLLASDADGDIAAITVAASDLQTIELGLSTGLRPGSIVLAIGHPFGVVGAATAGTVVGVGQDLPEVGRPSRPWIAVSLNLRPGNSGGPLVDVEGRLVGINTMMTGPQAGMAVPVQVAKEFLKKAMLSRKVA
jgi:S1-C subfamily serine protease